MTYLLDSKLLSDKLYGFIKGRSTMLQLLHGWTEYLENGGHIDVIIVILKRSSIRFLTNDYFPNFSHII